ncbi:MAG TPA: signal peptidase I [Epulopiscium sp.]|nr:signal peptidase I [Candidatus Epulonipiscium sp.]
MKDKLSDENKIPKNNKRDWIETIMIGIVVIVINVFFFNITVVRGDSMNPTLGDGDRLILKKYETLLNIEEYNKGDIVAFKSPIDKDNRFFIKRVVGIPGDKINIIEGNLYINDEYIKEPYVENECFTESLSYGANFIVPEDQIFVIGDNRSPGGSNDSRSFGSISIKEIKGKVVLRIFPFNKIGKALDNR